MARNRKNKSKEQRADKQSQQDKKTRPAPKMPASKRTAEVMTDPMAAEESDHEDQRPARRQRTTDSPSADGNAKPRFQTRLLQPSKSKETPPPPPPPSSAVSAHHPLNPPHSTSLSQHYRVENITISRNCDMQAKIRRIRELLVQPLQAEGPTTTQAPLIVTVSAREDAAGKAVSIVEIVKGIFREDDQTCYQYTGLWSRLELLPGPMEEKFGPGRRLKDGAVRSGDEGEDEEMPDAEAQGGVGVEKGGGAGDGEEEGSQHFQVMEVLQRAKVRNIALTTMYLAREPIAMLRNLFGEQTSAET